MNTKDLERLVASVVDMKPHKFIDKKKSVKLIDSRSSLIKNSKSSKAVLERKNKVETQQVAQEVAQGTWVAQKGVQKGAQKVAQTKQKPLVQKVPGKVQSLVARKEVEIIKMKLAEMVTTEERKNYLKSIGINIKVERRSKSYYLYGIKKIDGKKERFYAGSVLSL